VGLDVQDIADFVDDLDTAGSAVCLDILGSVDYLGFQVQVGADIRGLAVGRVILDLAHTQDFVGHQDTADTADDQGILDFPVIQHSNLAIRGFVVSPDIQVFQVEVDTLDFLVSPGTVVFVESQATQDFVV
jgi:hypothetical protein